MKTITRYILRLSAYGDRVSYKSRGTTTTTQGLFPELGGHWSDCSKCKKTVSHQSDYVIMKNRWSTKYEWWNDYVGSICEECYKTVDNIGRIYISIEDKPSQSYTTH